MASLLPSAAKLTYYMDIFKEWLFGKTVCRDLGISDKNKENTGLMD